MKDKYYYKDGSVLDCWDRNKILHREDGPAVEFANGGKHWWINNKRHREDGPAVEFADGSKGWWIDGECHREDGPAVEYSDGEKEYWINGKHLTKKEFEAHPVRINYLFTKALEKELKEG